MEIAAIIYLSSCYYPTTTFGLETHAWAWSGDLPKREGKNNMEKSCWEELATTLLITGSSSLGTVSFLSYLDSVSSVLSKALNHSHWTRTGMQHPEDYQKAV